MGKLPFFCFHLVSILPDWIPDGTNGNRSIT